MVMDKLQNTQPLTLVYLDRWITQLITEVPFVLCLVPVKAVRYVAGYSESSACYAVHVARNELHVWKNESEKQSRTSSLIIDVQFGLGLRKFAYVSY